MNTLPRWIAFASFATVLVLATSSARALTDSNAEMKEAAADRTVRVVVTGKAGIPRRVVYVPVTAKSLDGFKPALPPERAETLAKADAPKSR